MDYLLQLAPLVTFAAMFSVMVWAAGTIMTKAGYRRALGILWLIPFVNFLYFVWLARSEWPIESEVKRLRETLDIVQGIKG